MKENLGISSCLAIYFFNRKKGGSKIKNFMSWSEIQFVHSTDSRKVDGSTVIFALYFSMTFAHVISTV